MVSWPVRTKERIKVSPHLPHPATQYGKPFTVTRECPHFSRLEIEKKSLFSRLWRLPPSQTCSVPLQPMQHDLFHKRATVSLFSLAVDEVFFFSSHSLVDNVRLCYVYSSLFPIDTTTMRNKRESSEISALDSR